MLFERDDLVDALELLADSLVAEGGAACIRVVGGAAIAISHDRSGVTADIDALYGSSEKVDAVVRRIAEERNWPPTWLNNAVKMYASDFDHLAEWSTFLERDEVRILLAPPDLLLAMKLKAGRGRRDSGDIASLLDALAVENVMAAEEIFDRYYPRDEIAPDARRQVEELFPET